MFPENIIQACTQQISTIYRKKKVLVNLGNITSNESIFAFEVVKDLKYTDGTNVMGELQHTHTIMLQTIQKLI
jgi:hypothetical protein